MPCSGCKAHTVRYYTVEGQYYCSVDCCVVHNPGRKVKVAARKHEQTGALLGESWKSSPGIFMRHVELTIAAVVAAYHEGLPLQPSGPAVTAVGRLKKQTRNEFGAMYRLYGIDPTQLLIEWDRHIDLAVQFVVHAFSKDSAAIADDTEALLGNINEIVRLQVVLKDGREPPQMGDIFEDHIVTTGAYISHAADKGIIGPEWERLTEAAIDVGTQMGKSIDSYY